jgi:RHS repeat-associated protein
LSSVGVASVVLSAGLTVAVVASAVSPAGATTTAPSVLAWGDNSFGQFGIAPPPSSSGVEGRVSNGLPAGGWAQVVATQEAVGALKDDGTVWTWGSGCTVLGRAAGCLTTPAQVVGISGVNALAAGASHMLALKSDGTVWGWGSNRVGELGNHGVVGDSYTPVQALNLTGVVAIAAGGWVGGADDSYALKSDGTVWAWGWNSWGQLGNGTTGTGQSDGTPHPDAVQVSGLSGVASITAGAGFGSAVKSDGSVWSWGWNAYGQLGNNSQTDSNVAVQASGLTGVAQASAPSTGTHVLTVRSDGSVWSWGNNGEDELGYDTNNLSGLVPAQIPKLAQVATIGAGRWNSYAVRTDGSAWAWGDNAYGQLGSNVPYDTSLTPVSLFDVDGAVSVAGGAGFAVAAATQGTGPTRSEVWVPNASEPNASCSCGGQVDAATGNFYETFQDVAIPGRGPALSESRTYGALNASQDGPFGFGWSSAYGMHLELGTVVPGLPPATVDVVQENGALVSFSWNGSAYVAPPRVLAALEPDVDGVGTFTFTRRAQERFVFDATGLLIKEIARNGFAGSPSPSVAAAYTTNLAYTGGDLSTVTDAAGRTLTFSYGPNGKVSEIADSTGRTVGYGYDGAGNLTDVTDVALGNTHFTYYSNHQLWTVRDPRGNTVETNVYDSVGRLLTRTDGLSRTTAFDYTSILGSTKVTDPKNNAVVYGFTDNMLTSQTRGYDTPDAATWQYGYDPSPVGVATVTDPNLNVTHYTWDPTGNPLTIKDALDHTKTYTYNAFGEPLTIQDPKLVTTTNVYDSAGNLTSTSTPLVEQPGQTQITTYDHTDTAHPGDVTSITDPRLKQWLFSYYPSTGDLFSQTTPLGDKTTYTYNPAGQRQTMVSPNGNVLGGNPSLYTTTYVPDAFGHDIRVTDPLGHLTQQVYDADGNLHQVLDPSTPTPQTTTYTYDAANELTEINRPDTSNLYNAYWPDGSLETQKDGASNVTTYTYDPLGRLSVTQDPKLRATHYTYDGVGNLTKVVDPELQSTTYGYDTANELCWKMTAVATGTCSSPPTGATTFSYDADGQRLTMADGTGTTTLVWDSLHRLTSKQNGALQTMSYGYDLADNLTSIIYPGPHTVMRVYDDSGRLHTITDWLTPSNTTTYDYDHNSNLKTQTYPNSTIATYTPDAANRLMNIADTLSGTTFASFGYGRNNDDLVTSVTPTGVGQSNESYGYSRLNQLNAVNGSSFTFDAADNMIGMSNGTKLSYDNANQLCRTAPSTPSCTGTVPTDTTAYTYGADGERTSMAPAATTGDPTVSYTYNPLGQLTGVQGAGYRTAVLATNPLGYWRLSDPALSTTAADSSGNAHAATATAVTFGSAGSALTTDGDKAATFNGTSSYISLCPASPPPGCASPAIGVGNSTTFSAEAWIKGAATVGRYFLTEGSTSTNTPYWGLATDGTTGTHAIFTVRDSSSHVATATGTKTISDGNWHHIVGIRNNHTVSLYVDGALDATTTLSTLGSLSVGLMTIGALQRQATVSNYFNGTLDDAAIYGASLTPAQIRDHYQAAKSNYAGTAISNGPSAYWRLGETTGTSAADISGNAHTGTYQGTGGYTLGQPSALVPSTDDKSVKFLGTTGYVDGGSVGAGQSSTFSIEAWVKTNQSSGTVGYFVSEGRSVVSNNPVEGLTLSSTFTKAIFTIRDDAGTQIVVTGTTTVNDNVWHHIVGVRNGTTLSLYVDGKLDASSTAGGSLTTITLNTATVGALHRSGITNYATGTIDEVALYPFALDAATVARHHNNGTTASPTVAVYNYDGDGSRTTKTVDGNTTNFTWDNAEGRPLLASDGNTQYVYGPGGVPLEQINGSNVDFYHQDQQGSTRALTDQSGNLVATYSTDAYGIPTASSGSVQTPLRYDGEYRDNETGNIYLRARFYDPTTAQFLVRDPAVSATRSPYGYAAGNPLNRVDPTGLSWWNPFSWSAKTWATVGIGALVVAGTVICIAAEPCALAASAAVVGGGGDELAQVADDAGGQATETGGGTVWDSISATQPAYEGTELPRSFVLNVGEGENAWVAPNASEHILERIGNVSEGLQSIQTQNMLSSLRAAVEAANEQGISLGKMTRIGGWDLMFDAPRAGELYPVLHHALYLG